MHLVFDTPVEEAEAAGDEAQAADGPMTEASLNKLLLKDLRTMCQDKGVSIQGKKAELVSDRHTSFIYFFRTHRFRQNKFISSTDRSLLLIERLLKAE